MLVECGLLAVAQLDGPLDGFEVGELGAGRVQVDDDDFGGLLATVVPAGLGFYLEVLGLVVDFGGSHLAAHFLVLLGAVLCL